MNLKINFYLGVIVEITPLITWLDGGSTTLVWSLQVTNSMIWISDSGIESHMFSSSLTTSAMEGLDSVSSMQHLSAKVTNFSTHAGG